jgi:hypothetical protein
MNREEAELARLLRLAREADLPDAERLARVRARVLSPSAAGGSPAQELPVSGAKLGALGAKIVAGLAAVGLAVWAYEPPAQPAVPAPVHETLPPPAVAELPLAGAGVEPVSVEVSEPAPAPAQAKPERRPLRRRAKQVQEPAPAPATLAEQAAMLQMAAVALRAGQLDRAGESLAEFARRHPDSQLTPDRIKLEQRLQQLRAARP